MTNQPSLFDAPQPVSGYRKGMQESAKAAGKWTADEVAQVDRAIELCAKFCPEFTSDQIWGRLPSDFPVTKGLASRLNAAARRGLIEATDRTRKASRGGDHDHGQRLTIWRSL
jgi:hypothetical protein